MKSNVGIIDRALRLFLSLLIGMLLLTDLVHGTLSIVLVVLAAVLFFTGLMRLCPLYLPFSIDTWSKKTKNK